MSKKDSRKEAGKKRLNPFDDPKVKWIKRGVNPKGALQLIWKDGKAVWKEIPTRWGVRKATKKEAREIMKQAREGLGLVTINRKKGA